MQAMVDRAMDGAIAVARHVLHHVLGKPDSVAETLAAKPDATTENSLKANVTASGRERKRRRRPFVVAERQVQRRGRFLRLA